MGLIKFIIYAIVVLGTAFLMGQEVLWGLVTFKSKQYDMTLWLVATFLLHGILLYVFTKYMTFW